MDLNRARQLLAAHDQDLVELADRLDREARSFRGDSKRADPRFPYRAGVLVITLIDPEGARTNTVAFPRNLSTGGISLIKRGYAFPGWAVNIALRRQKADPLVVKGVIRSCRHLTHSLHEVGIQFDQPIDPRFFCEPGAIREVLTTMRSEGPLPELSGVALVISGVEQARRELRAMLADTGMQVVACASPPDAADLLKSNTYDAVVIDADVLDVNLPNPFPTIRDAGHEGAIVALSWASPEDCAKRFHPDARMHFLQHPADPHALASLIEAVTDQQKPPAADAA